MTGQGQKVNISFQVIGMSNSDLLQRLLFQLATSFMETRFAIT